MQALNLLPVDLRAEQRPFLSLGLGRRQALQVSGLAALVAVVAVGGLYYHERSTVNARQGDLAAAQAQLAAIQGRVDAIQAVQSKLNGHLVAIRAISGSSMNWDGTLSDLGRVLPASVYLTSLQASAPTPAVATVGTPSGGTSFTIAGVAASDVRIALVLDRLALLPWLSNVALQSATRQADGTLVFTATASVVATPSKQGGSGS